jgi:hypothetical protein
LIASARSSVFIAQQDLHGICEPPAAGIAPRFDRRLLDVLAPQLLPGVDVRNHSKLGMVDNCAIWVGSHNLYPFWLAEFNLLIEDRRVARIFKRDYADPLWRYSARRGPLPGKACGAIVQHSHVSGRSDTHADEVVGLG